jgi:NADH-quinone oxidoreductase subunit A
VTSNLALFIFISIVVVVSLGILLLSYFLGNRPLTPEKTVPYECGMDPITQPASLFSVKFYKIALIFVIFDVETVFIYLWAVVAKEMGGVGLIQIFIFIVILLVPLFYAWREGDLKWE